VSKLFKTYLATDPDGVQRTVKLLSVIYVNGMPCELYRSENGNNPSSPSVLTKFDAQCEPNRFYGSIAPNFYSSMKAWRNVMKRKPLCLAASNTRGNTERITGWPFAVVAALPSCTSKMSRAARL
jgi:hypothetical protein